MKTVMMILSSLLLLAAAILGAGCAEPATESAAQPAANITQSAPKPAPPPAQAATSLASQLGGMTTVSQLADAFGANIAADPTLSKSIDAAGITQVKNGLVNDVARASSMSPPNGTVDLLSALSGKGLDASAVAALNSALTSAASQVHLSPAQTTAMTALVSPVFAKLAP